MSNVLPPKYQKSYEKWCKTHPVKVARRQASWEMRRDAWNMRYKKKLPIDSIAVLIGRTPEHVKLLLQRHGVFLQRQMKSPVETSTYLSHSAHAAAIERILPKKRGEFGNDLMILKTVVNRMIRHYKAAIGEKMNDDQGDQ